MKSAKKVQIAGGIVLILILGGVAYWLNQPSMTVETVGPAPPPMTPSKAAAEEPTPKAPTGEPRPGSAPVRSRGGGGVRNPNGG